MEDYIIKIIRKRRHYTVIDDVKLGVREIIREKTT
jgi:hypothetical protein